MASPRQVMESQVASYPTQAQSFLTHGFKVVTRLSDEERKTFLDALINDFRGGKRRLLTDVEKNSSLSKSEASQISSVYSVVMGLLGENNATIEDFIAAARGKLFDPEDEPAARLLANDICQARADLGTFLDARNLSGSVLPSFIELEMALDVRLKFKDGQLDTYAPVIIAYLATDESYNRLWFQMTKGDVQGLIGQLTKVLSDIESSELLMAKK